MSEEFDMEWLPGNPRMCETIQQFFSRQRKLIGQTKWPPGTTFGCRQCGDCCKWNFLVLNTDEKLTKELHSRAKYPHGSWNLNEQDKLRISLPGFSGKRGLK